MNATQTPAPSMQQYVAAQAAWLRHELSTETLTVLREAAFQTMLDHQTHGAITAHADTIQAREGCSYAAALEMALQLVSQ